MTQVGSWRLVDKLIAGYGLSVTVIAATRLDQRGVAWIAVAHLALPLLAWLVTQVKRSTFGNILRSMYPVVLLIGLYSSIDVLNGFGSAQIFDAPLQQLEAAIFGAQPSRDWWRSSPSALWSFVMHAVYFSYYVIIPLPLLVLLITGKREEVEPYLNGVIATFLICYLCYMLLPVAGPYYEFSRPTGEFIANGPAQLVYATLAKGSSFGAAFPSSHVAATVAATIGAWRVLPKLGWILAVPTALLTVGVVYTQMHYVVDSAAGVLVGVMVPVAVWRITADG